MNGIDEAIQQMCDEANEYLTCMSVSVDEEMGLVTLELDTSISTYVSSLPEEGAVSGLIREQDTHRVVGVILPLRNTRLNVSHDGPIRINSGFRKDDGL